MSELFCDVGRGIRLCYESFGDPENPPLLLVMGLGMQMIAWDDAFCEQLAGRGFHVIRFDNRDQGLSTHTSDPLPTVRQLLSRHLPPGRYLLSDMATDAVELLRRLELSPAHVVGVSMGGMIAQTMAAEHPDAVRSLVSIMSNTGHRLRGQPAPRIYPLLLARPTREREVALARAERIFKLIGSPAYPHDPARVRELISRSLDRDPDPLGVARQLGAIVGSGDRTRQLRGITAPTLVIHGTRDRMVSPSGGRATARAIPGARLLMIEGMGHDLPPEAWPRIIGAIADQAAGADAAMAAAASNPVEGVQT
jgi:pimeloyl-ACP methyl ester carboxylesterase